MLTVEEMMKQVRSQEEWESRLGLNKSVADMLAEVDTNPTMPEMTPEQASFFDSLEPPEELMMPKMPSMTATPGTTQSIGSFLTDTAGRIGRGAGMMGEDLLSGVRQGAAGIVDMFRPSPMETDRLKYMQSLSDDELRKGIAEGKFNQSARWFSSLPEDVQGRGLAKFRESIDNTIAGREAWDKGVGAVSGMVAPEAPAEPLPGYRQMFRDVAGIIPTAGAVAAGGVPAMVGLTLGGLNDAEKAVYQKSLANGATQEEAYQNATNTWGRLGQALATGAKYALMGAAGKVLPMNIGGDVSPYLNQALRVAGQAGGAGLGGGAESAVTDLRAGTDVDWGAADRAAVSNLIGAGLLGLFNTAMNFKQLKGKQQAHNAVNEHVSRINNAMGELGLPGISNGNTLSDAAMVLGNNIRGGNVTRQAVYDAFVKAGFDPQQVDYVLRHAGRPYGNDQYKGYERGGRAKAQQPETVIAGELPETSRTTQQRTADNRSNLQNLADTLDVPNTENMLDYIQGGIQGGNIKPADAYNAIVNAGFSDSVARDVVNYATTQPVTPEAQAYWETKQGLQRPDALAVERAIQSEAGHLSGLMNDVVAKNTARQQETQAANDRADAMFNAIQSVGKGSTAEARRTAELYRQSQMLSQPEPQQNIPAVPEQQEARPTDTAMPQLPPMPEPETPKTETAQKETPEFVVEERQAGEIVPTEGPQTTTERGNITGTLEKIASQQIEPTAKPKAKGRSKAKAKAEPDMPSAPIVPTAKQEEEEPETPQAEQKAPEMQEVQPTEHQEVAAGEPEPAGDWDTKYNETLKNVKDPDGAIDKVSTKLYSEISRRAFPFSADKDPITNQQIVDMFPEEYRKNNYITDNDIQDVKEHAVNRHVSWLESDFDVRRRAERAGQSISDTVKAHLKGFDNLMDILPAQAVTNRSVKQNEFQQFSTPPHIAWFAGLMLDPHDNDVILEPSAGLGGLIAGLPKKSGTKYLVNEIDPHRAAFLYSVAEHKANGAENVKLTHENAEYIDSVDALKGHTPTRVIMNPPFSSNYVTGKADPMTAARHLKSALNKLAPGGRLVAVLGKGMGDDAKSFREFWSGIRENSNIRANIELDGKLYRKYGTTFGTRIVVIDKTAPDGIPTVTGKFDNLIDAVDPMMSVLQLSPGFDFDDNEIKELKALWDGVGQEKKKAKKRTKKKTEKQTKPQTEEPEATPAEPEKPEKPGEDEPVPEAKPDPKPEPKAEPKPEPKAEPEPKSETEPEPKAEPDPHEFAKLQKLQGTAKQIAWATDIRAKFFYNGMGNIMETNARAADVFVDHLRKQADAGWWIRNRGELQLDLRKTLLRDIENFFGIRHKPLTKPDERWATLAPKLDTLSDTEIVRLYDGIITKEYDWWEEDYLDDDVAIGTHVYDRYFTNETVDEKQEAQPTEKQEATPTEKQETENTGAQKTPKKNMAKQETPKETAPKEETPKPSAEKQEEPEPDEKPETEPKTDKEKSVKRVDTLEKKTRSKEEDITAEAVFEKFKPRLSIDGVKASKHPANLVVPANMTDIKPPVISHEPTDMLKKLVKDGKISDAQLETVLMACDAMDRMLPDGERRQGFMIGDGTGVGKGREISACILEVLARGYGNGKAVWVSENEKLCEDARRDYGALTSASEANKKIVKQSKWKADAKIDHDGVLFTWYPTIRYTGDSRDSEEVDPGTTNDIEFPRINQIIDWVGKDYDGIIVFDEAHKLGNPVNIKGVRGERKASKQALAGVALQQALPEAHILYVSATIASEANNMGALDRLGLWGEGTAFPSRGNFLTEVEKSGMGMMEITAHDMAASGLYSSRSISMDGVEFEPLVVPILEDASMCAEYDTIAEAWQIVNKGIDSAVRMTCRGSYNKSAFWSAQIRCYKNLLMNMKFQALCKRIDKALANNQSVVVQLMDTGEADLDKLLERIEADRLDDSIKPEDKMTLDSASSKIITPLVEFLHSSFPVQAYAEDKDGNSKPLLDSRGNPVLNIDAVRLRDELLMKVKTINLSGSIIDDIIERYGEENVAEITGRTKRVAVKEGKKVVERRNKSAVKSDLDGFLYGKNKKGEPFDGKRILIFSKAGGTGMSYHAGVDFNNQQQRVHIVMDMGWNAKDAVQAMGRTVRSGSVNSPIMVLVTTDIPGEKRLTSAIARRLSELGAMTKADRRGVSNGMYSASDNLESKYALGAVRDVIRNCIRNKEGWECLLMMGFRPDTLSKSDKALKDITVSQFLNRLFNLKLDLQKKIFDAFKTNMDALIADAIENNTFDSGVRNLRGEKITLLKNEVINGEEDKGGQVTRHQVFEVYRKTIINNLSDLQREGYKGFYRLNRNGRVFTVKDIQKREYDTTEGRYENFLLCKSPDVLKREERSEADIARNAVKLSDEEGRKLWAEQTDALPKYHKDLQHMVSGALLPVWDKLSNIPYSLWRATTDDGQMFLGRIFTQKQANDVLLNFGLGENYREYKAEDVISKLDKTGKYMNFSTGWTAERSVRYGQPVIKLKKLGWQMVEALTKMGLDSNQAGRSGAVEFYIQADDVSSMRHVMKLQAAGYVKEANELSLEESEAEIINEHLSDDDLTNLHFLPPGMNPFSASKAEAAVANGDIKLGGQPLYNSELQPSSEERIRAAMKAVRKEDGFFNSGWNNIKKFFKGLTGDYPYLPSTNEEFIKVKYALRARNRAIQAEIDKAIRHIEASVKNLTPEEFNLFVRKRIFDDLMHRKSVMPEAGLPFGMSEEEFRAEHESLSKAVKQYPAVLDALDRDKRYREEITGAFIKEAKSLGWNGVAGKFKNPDYYPHNIIQYLEAMIEGKYHNGLHVRENRGFLKRYRGSDKDYSTNYLYVMATYASIMGQDTATMKALSDIRKACDIMPYLKREAWKMNEAKVLAQFMEEYMDTHNNATLEEAGEASVKQYRKMFNRGQATAMDKLKRLAMEDELPDDNGKYADIIDALANGDEFESEEMRNGLNRFMGWLAGLALSNETMSEADMVSNGIARGVAREYFVSVGRKKKAIKQMLNKDFVTYRDLMPDGMATYDPFLFPMVYNVKSVPQWIVDAALEQGLDEVGVKLKDIKTQKVFGGHRQLWVIPTEVADTLEEIGYRKPVGELQKIAEALTSKWKVWALFSPFRFTMYNIRNFVGDLEAVILGYPRAIRPEYLKKAVVDLWPYFTKGKAPTGDLLGYVKEGGAVITKRTQELGSIENDIRFKHLKRKSEAYIGMEESKGNKAKRFAKWLGKIPVDISDEYLKTTGMISDFREQVLRYSAYLALKDDIMENGGRPSTWAASNPAEIMALGSDNAKAYTMSNELLGAYDQVSVSGQELRRFVIPFWSWLEVNPRRFFRMFKNAYDGMFGGGGGRIPPNNGGGGNAPDEPPYNGNGGGQGGYNTVLYLFMGLSSMYLARTLWNWLVCGDKEAELSEDVRRRSHITMPWRFDGQPAYIDRLGSIGDLAEWVGLADLPSDIVDIIDGRMTWGEFTGKMATAPINKLVNGLNPIIKTPVEMWSGKSAYPNVSNPRTVRDPWEYFFNSLGLANEYRFMAGKPHKPYSIDRALHGMAFYSPDQDEMSYWSILGMRRNFDENVLGKKFNSFAASPKGQALYEYKRAIRYGDEDAKQKYIGRYFEFGGTVKGIKQSANSLSPFYGLNKVDKARFIEWLPDYMKKGKGNKPSELGRAMLYAKEMGYDMLH